MSAALDIHDIPTPALLVDADAFEHNVRTMGEALPGGRLRPHVKAFKSTALAGELAAAGHRAFCAATPKEVVGMAASGLGEDLLLANETVDLDRLRATGRAVWADRFEAAGWPRTGGRGPAVLAP